MCSISTQTPPVPNDEPPCIQGSMIRTYQKTGKAGATERVRVDGKARLSSKSTWDTFAGLSKRDEALDYAG
jgi:hypothetical protein